MAGLKTVLVAFFISLTISAFSSETYALTISHYNIPTVNSQPQGIAATSGPDAAIWFTETAGNKIGRLSLDGSTLNEYNTGLTAFSQPLGITPGPDGNLWFTEASSASGKIGKITTTGSITELTVPGYDPGTWDITVGPDGALWFTYYSRIENVTTGDVFSGYDLPGRQAFGITTGSDGALWFVEPGFIGRITTAGDITHYGIPLLDPGAGFIAAGPDDALWFTVQKSNKIGRVTTDGVFTIFDCPTPNSSVNFNHITAGPDGAIWFTESNTDKIGRITTFGSITEYDLPAGSDPVGIAAGSDGAIWITEAGFTANKIGKLSFTTYLIKTTATGNGTVSCDPNPVMEDTDALCLTTPDYGYHVYDVHAGDFGSSSSVGPTSFYYFDAVSGMKDIQAWFDPNGIRLYAGNSSVGGGSYVHDESTIQDGMDDPTVVSGAWIEVPAGAYVEGIGLTLNRSDDVTFTLSGGWNTDFLSKSGAASTIAGNLILEGTGALIIDGIAIE